MPRIITTDPGKNKTQGHCWPPTIPTIGSTDTFVGGFGVVRTEDTFDSVMHTGCTSPPSTHLVKPIQGSNNVFVNNLPVVRDGDPMGCGDVADGGDLTVYVNGGGSGQGEDPDETIGYTRNIPNIEYPGNIINIHYWVFLNQFGEEVFGEGCEFSFIH